MKKVLSVMAVSAFVMTAGVAFAGGPGKMSPACPEACQQQIDDLQSSQAQQNEELSAHAQQLDNHESRITALEAPNPWYARIGARAAWMTADNGMLGNIDDDFGAGFGAALAVGRVVDDYRFELELAMQDVEADTVGTLTPEITLTTVMANMYYDIPIQNGFSAYCMVGIGYGHFDTDDMSATADQSDNTVAYKAGLGVSYQFTNEFAGDLGYEFLGVVDGEDVANNVEGHNIVASLRYMF